MKRFFFRRLLCHSSAAEFHQNPSPLATQIIHLCKDALLSQAILILNSFHGIRSLGLLFDVYASLLRAASKTNSLRTGFSIHSQIIKLGLSSDRFVGNSLLSLYLKSHDVAGTRRVFDAIAVKDVVSWTSVISNYAKKGMQEEAIRLFEEMQRNGTEPNEFSLSIMIKVAAERVDVELGKRLHTMVSEMGFDRNFIVCTAMIDMYCKFGSLDNARRVFDEMPERDSVSWASMISGLVKREKYKEALTWFLRMREEVKGVIFDRFLSGSLLTACGNLGLIEQGRQIHAMSIVSGISEHVIIGTAMVDMYGKCRFPEIARQVFDIMPQRNVFTCCSMLGGYCENSNYSSVLEFFREMQKEFDFANKDDFCFATVLRACTKLSALRHGKEIHCQFVKMDAGYGNVVVESALIDMYSESGDVDNARMVFSHTCSMKNVIVWNSMIGGLAQNGYGEEALTVYDNMIQHGIIPDQVTLAVVLFACNHSGLVEQGREYFKSMTGDYGLNAKFEHYASMVDMIARAGHVEEAERLIKGSKFAEDSSLWIALLGACASYSSLDQTERVAELTINRKLDNHLTYVLLSKAYASSGRFSDAEKVRKVMKSKGMEKVPGRSWVESRKSMVHALRC